MTFFAISRSQPLVLRSVTALVLENERLEAECAQLRQAVSSHAVVDQAIGAVCAMGRLPVEEAWRVLRDVSQRTNTKLRTVAEHVLVFARGGDLPQDELGELHQAIRRYTARTDASAGVPPRRD
jgi:hypothetical protein